MAPRARFELATNRLTADCSTIELPGTDGKKNNALDATGRIIRKICRWNRKRGKNGQNPESYFVSHTTISRPTYWSGRR